MHWSSKEIMRDLKSRAPHRPRVTRFYVPEHSTTWNPQSNTDHIPGQCWVTYTEHKDGRITAEIT